MRTDIRVSGTTLKDDAPAKASAKVDFRLVPNQTPREVLAKLRAHLDKQGFTDVQIKFMGGDGPGRTDPGEPFVQLAVWMAEEVYGKSAQIIPMPAAQARMRSLLKCWMYQS